MCTIAELNRRFGNLNLRRELPVIIEDRELEIVTENKNQLLHGLDGDGDEISPGYALYTYSLDKNMMNSLPTFGTPDLKYTGAFYSGFMLQNVTQEGFEITSSDNKTPGLTRKYGPAIFSLSKASWEKLNREVFGPDIRQYITNVTKLAFT